MNKPKPNKPDPLASSNGSLGGKSRRRNLTPAQRTELARNAAAARWSKPPASPTPEDEAASLFKALKRNGEKNGRA